MCEPLLLRREALTPGAFTLDAGILIAGSSPVNEPQLASRWLAFFAFAQAVHYGVWLKCIPEEDTSRSIVAAGG